MTRNRLKIDSRVVDSTDSRLTTWHTRQQNVRQFISRYTHLGQTISQSIRKLLFELRLIFLFHYCYHKSYVRSVITLCIASSVWICESVYTILRLIDNKLSSRPIRTSHKASSTVSMVAIRCDHCTRGTRFEALTTHINSSQGHCDSWLWIWWISRVQCLGLSGGLSFKNVSYYLWISHWITL